MAKVWAALFGADVRYSPVVLVGVVRREVEAGTEGVAFPSSEGPDAVVVRGIA